MWSKFYLSFYCSNIKTIVMATCHDIEAIVILKDNDRDKQPCCHISCFKPDEYMRKTLRLYSKKEQSLSITATKCQHRESRGQRQP